MKQILFGIVFILLASCGNKKESFEWNFNTNNNYIYSFSQTTTSESKMSKKDKSDHSYISGKGQIIITSKSNDLADLSFVDLKVKMKNDFTNDTISQSQPNNVIQDLKSDGNFSVTFNTNDFIRLLFPIPNKNLSKGNRSDIPMILPYNINGSVINSKGFNSLQFTNYEVINGHKCAVLIGDINISTLDLPENFEGNYELSQIGKGTYYFDIENGYYIKSKVNFTLKSLADNEDLYINASSTNEYEINLIEVTDPLNKTNKHQSSIINSTENTPIDIAKSVIEFLQKKDTTKYLNIAIPFEKQKKLFAENMKFNPQENDTMSIFRNLKKKYEDRTDNFLVRAGYILDIMKNDKEFEIEKATIDTIYYKLEKTKNYGNFSKTLIGNWADLTVEMNYNNEKYYFEIPQIIKVDNTWYLYYPEYYLRDQREKDFVEKRVKELKKQAEEFWK
jgi:hypothetical protein